MIRNFINLLGFNYKVLWRNILSLRLYLKDYKILKIQMRENKQNWKIKLYPMLLDNSSENISNNGHYFLQDLYVAKKIFKEKPNLHLDIGSRVDGFIAHVASFREIDVMDIRPIKQKIWNINFVQNDLMNPKIMMNEKYDSLSCLHAIEHFGLGRYGDKIDINGHLVGLANIAEYIGKNGIFYFSTQIGKQRIEFNAHRVFSLHYLLNIFNEKYNLLEFSYIDDHGIFHENIRLNDSLVQEDCGCNLGCGIFILKKK